VYVKAAGFTAFAMLAFAMIGKDFTAFVTTVKTWL
jgi:hypothetical protein